MAMKKEKKQKETFPNCTKTLTTVSTQSDRKMCIFVCQTTSKKDSGGKLTNINKIKKCFKKKQTNYKL